MKKSQAHFVSVPNDPGIWKFLLRTSRLVQKIKSRLLAYLFHAPGLYLGNGSVVRGVNHISFGRNFYAHGNLWLEAVSHYQQQHFTPHISFGDDVSVSDGVHITCIESISVAKNVLIGSRVYISDHNHGVYKGKLQSLPSESPGKRLLGGGGPVIIGSNVWIGDNVVLIGPLTIGEGAIVGANSVVTHDVPARTIVAGVPARAIKHFNDETNTWNPL